MAFDLNDPSFRDAEFRKGEFRETSRNIVSKDRSSKKYGFSVDAGGSIARALEAAYKLGLAHGADSKGDAKPASRRASSQASYVSWNTIPPRPRAIFERILQCKWIVMLVTDASPWQKPSDKWACYWDGGERKPEGQRYELAETFSRSTLAPIIRLGLMEERVIAGSTLLEPTPLAAATFAAAVAAGHVRVWG